MQRRSSIISGICCADADRSPYLAERTGAKLEPPEDVPLRTPSLPTDEEMDASDGDLAAEAGGNKRASRAVRQKAAQQRYRQAALNIGLLLLLSLSPLSGAAAVEHPLTQMPCC